MRSWIPALTALALLGVGSGATSRVVDDEEATDPAYWIDRMEQALLPQASMRALATLEDAGAPGPSRELRLELARVQGPDRIRSIVAVRSPTSEHAVVKVASGPEGEVRRVAYTGVRAGIEHRRDRHDAFLLSALRYEDLGFVGLGHRALDARVEVEELSDGLGGRTVRVTTGPHGPHGRVVTRLDWETALPREVEYFDRQGVLQRTVEYGEVEHRDAYAYPMRIEALEPATGRRSVLRFQRVELGATIYEYEFRAPHLNDLLDALQAEPDRAPRGRLLEPSGAAAD